jgi:hypothetical protein
VILRPGAAWLLAGSLAVLAAGGVWHGLRAQPPQIPPSQPALEMNRITEGELAQLPGVSRRLAREIIAARQTRGAFAQWEELLAVPGVGPGRLQRLRAGVPRLGRAAIEPAAVPTADLSMPNR